jgi:hypothetical protein
MCALSEEATRSMSVLSPRHVALAVNAAAAREGGERVLAAAAQRILQVNKKHESSLLTAVILGLLALLALKYKY